MTLQLDLLRALHAALLEGTRGRPASLGRSCMHRAWCIALAGRCSSQATSFGKHGKTTLPYTAKSSF